jgi:hypothetical protein
MPSCKPAKTAAQAAPRTVPLNAIFTWNDHTNALCYMMVADRAGLTRPKSIRLCSSLTFEGASHRTCRQLLRTREVRPDVQVVNCRQRICSESES